MRVTGVVSFINHVKSNQVTIEGAKALLSALSSNATSLITNILYVTDYDKATGLMRTASAGGAKLVNWADLVPNSDPSTSGNWVINPLIKSCITTDADLAEEGNILISSLDTGDIAVPGLRCSVRWDVSTWPTSVSSVYGMALVLNGNSTISNASYLPSRSEKLLAYLDLLSTPLQMSPSRSNAYTWDVKVSVNKEER